MGTSKRSSFPKAMVMSMAVSSSSTRTSWIQVWASIWLPLGIMPRMVRTVAASRVRAPSPRGIPKAPGSSGNAWPTSGTLLAGHDDSTSPLRARAEGLTTVGPASASDRGQRLERLVAQSVGDAVRLGVADEHGVDDLVDGARADES